MDRGVMFQYFEWNCKNDGSLWRDLTDKAQEIKNLGTTAIWLPPAYKAMNGVNDTGYAVYDLYDLGEFDQKGTVRTKYGTKDEYLEAIKAAQKVGMDVYADVVLNHKMGGDAIEELEAVQIDNGNRNTKVSEPYKIKAWSQYNFPGRGDKYSSFKWNKDHFTSFGCNADLDGDCGHIYLATNKTFSGEVDNEFGNFDYLMGADVDQYHPEVHAELVRWANWYLEMTGVNGFRLDAVKHIPSSFYKKFFEEVRAHNKGREVFAVGEYWSYDVGPLQKYMHDTDGAMRLFDVPLHFKLHQASKAGNNFDMRQIFDGTLVKDSPLMAVTFVDNHDSQPGQSLQSWVEDWFKPMAYALVLLREHGYPCLFYGDYFGNTGDNKLTCHRKIIDDLLDARHHHAHGTLTDYLDHPNCIGWTWTGDEEHPGSMAVVMTNGDAGTKRMHMPECCGHTYRDITGHVGEPVTTDCDGWADFVCPPGSLSVWISKP